MLYKLYSRKGNITIVLVGLISVMLIMVAAMSRRMSGHSQLLTLGDYTQISRYFLESYVGDVMQQMRYASNDPKSTFSKEICDSISDADTSKKLSISFYNASDQLITLAHELEIDISKSKPTLEIINTEPLNYPAGIDAGAQNGKEKKGLLQLTCECVFRKREYKLTVQYPFIVVFRVTPVLKEFMLFVDNMAKEQATNDTINILKIGKDKIADRQDLGESSGNYNIKPFILLQPLDFKYDTEETSGKIYLGPSDRAVYINLAGGSSDSKVNETYLVSQKDIGPDTEGYLEDVPVFQRKDNSEISLPGVRIALTYDDKANMGVMGFGDDFSEVFEGTAWKPEHFLGEGEDAGTYWGSMKKKHGSNATKAMNYASAMKLFGFNFDNIPIARNIYGNVFARFMLLTFWEPYSAPGIPLVYDPHRTVDQVPETRDWRNGVRKFLPQDNVGYQFFQSRIMSGFDWETQKNSLSQYKNFMPLNMNLRDKCHEVYSETEFTAPDGFSLDGGLKFHDFGKTWFRVSKNSSEEQSPIEQRIGRAFTSQEEFEEAVGYPKKFKVNGIVYVKGNLNLGDMNLSPDDCSGGVVLVDGNITLGNIYRGRKIDSRNLLKDTSASDYFKHWNEFANDEYIAQDKILTFVSLNGNPITLNGNVMLGVQLITLADHNGSGDQIKWNVNDGIVFYGSIACSRLNLKKRLQEFYRANTSDDSSDFPLFMYPPVMATDTPSLAVQIMENMRGYKLNTGKVFD